MFDAISDPALRLAAGVGLTALALTGAIASIIVGMRVQALRGQRRHERAVLRWRPLLVQVAAGDDCGAPPLQPGDAVPVLLLWNQMQESLRGAAHRRLNDFGERIGLYALAQRLEAQSAVAARVLGDAALGHFAKFADWSRLDRGMHELGTPASLAAARALMRIDAASAAERVFERYLNHSDWPAPRVGTLLREAPHAAIAGPLTRRLMAGKLYDRLRLLPLLRFAEVPNMHSLLDRLVQTSQEPQVLSIALRQLQGPAALADVRRLAAHADPLVRSAAAQALGRIGSAADQNRLIDLMGDANWWVRYRAAQSLVGMPRVQADDVVQLRRLVSDRYARDMLDQVMAERNLAAQALAA